MNNIINTNFFKRSFFNISLLVAVPIILQIGLSGNVDNLVPILQSYTPTTDSLLNLAHTYMPDLTNKLESSINAIKIGFGSLASYKGLVWVYRVFCSDE